MPEVSGAQDGKRGTRAFRVRAREAVEHAKHKEQKQVGHAI